MRHAQKTVITSALSVIVSLISAAALHAGPAQDIVATAPSTSAESSTAKKAPADVAPEDLAVLYDNKNNPILEKFFLTGEFQTQWADGTSNQGSFGTRDYNPNNRWGDIEVRRWRTGFDSEWFNSLRFWGTIDINPRVNPFYKDLYELGLTYTFSDAFSIGAGKTKARYFSQEYNTRTRELIEFEQSLLVNAIVPMQLTGAWINGKAGHWVYNFAAYSGDNRTEFSRFDVGSVYQSSIGYDFASALHAEKALVKFDYQHSDSTKNSDGAAKFGNAFSLNTTFQQGRFYGYTDFLGATGIGKQGDVWGGVFTPTYFLIDNKLQFIVRYQYAHGDNNGLNLQSRYEALAPGIVSNKGAGSEYNALYFGLNYYIHGHNLKLMAGTEYNDMTGGKKDYSGWTTLLGVRMAF